MYSPIIIINKGGNNIKEAIQKHLSKINSIISDLEAQLHSLPQGSLHIKHDGKYTKYYLYHNNKEQYLSKLRSPLISQLAYKKYVQANLDDLLNEKYSLELYLSNIANTSSTERLFSNSDFNAVFQFPHKASLLSEELYNWANTDYPSNPHHPETLIHSSPSGNILRSKSEAIIDMLLWQNNVPYRYECELILGETIMFPDFTIKHPVSGKLYYWEHFGLMDNSSYRKNAFSKLSLYSDYEIIPSINLITTFETKDNPLQVNDVLSIISQHFT